LPFAIFWKFFQNWQLKTSYSRVWITHQVDNSSSQDFWANFAYFFPNFAYFFPNFGEKMRNMAKNERNLG